MADRNATRALAWLVEVQKEAAQHLDRLKDTPQNAHLQHALRGICSVVQTARDTHAAKEGK